ncbi:hypothetical protein L3Q82_006069 [Xyrichtys novacula]|uniref:Uncharacterized protein n=1 Tax=Xyrichtys novacula TaxID=13765 RepID=A0AAV1GIW8_XYRNO|nr:hypothetical protein L3Q82_006069 [Xyrichtys novacula]
MWVGGETSAICTKLLEVASAFRVERARTSVPDPSASSPLSRFPVFVRGLSSDFHHQAELSIDAISRPTSSFICLARVAPAVEERSAALKTTKKKTGGDNRAGDKKRQRKRTHKDVFESY